MDITRTVKEVRAIRRAEPDQTWGLVPTMGALHDGHGALIRRARAQNDRVAVSIFVNPAQFDEAGDLEAYPRPIERDLALLESENIDLVWTPDPAEVYPAGFQTYVDVEAASLPLEGTSRPGHFRGVTTIVAKLFNIFQPTRAYFGQKDAQQVAVIRQMIRDLNFNLSLVVVPIVREDDGLAMSSRNQHLSLVERHAATVLYRALVVGRDAWEHGTHDADTLRQLMTRTVEAEPLARIDYISVANPVTLQELSGPVTHALLSMAVFIGETRLIDNLTLGSSEATH